MRLGIDCSAEPDVISAGGKFYYRGEEVDPWVLLHDRNGVDIMRLRLWVDPYDEEGHPYGGGTNDYPRMLALAKRAAKAGYKILLDFHYSDFWVDPSKQYLPKSWAKLNQEEVNREIYDYTRKTLLDLRRDGIEVEAVQVGNEISNGMVWPYGQLFGDSALPGIPIGGFDGLALALKAGLSAVKSVDPKIKTLLHLERSGDVKMQDHWLKNVIARGVEFDILGESYYPYWHGTLEELTANLDHIREIYHKPIWIVETAYPFSAEAYGGGDIDPMVDADFAEKNPGHPIPFPLSKEGQVDFLKALMALGERHGVEAIVYWEPTWLPRPGVSWSTRYGRDYIRESEKSDGNEWANQCLFGFDGEALPGLEAFSAK